MSNDTEMTEGGVEIHGTLETAGARVTGKSGREYVAVDLMNEMTGDHEEALTLILAPVLPLLPTVFNAYGDGKELKASLDIVALASILWQHQLHRHALAYLFLPVGDREFREEDVAERAADLKNLTLGAVIAVLRDFFDGASSSFRVIFGGSSTGKSATPTSANGASSAGRKRMK